MTVTSAVPIANNTTDVPTVAPTTVETLTTVTTEVATTAPMPTQVRQSWEGGNGSFAVDQITLNEGPAVFDSTTTGTGNFFVTLIDPAGVALNSIASFNGPGSGSKTIDVPESSDSYQLNVTATGPWKVSIA